MYDETQPTKPVYRIIDRAITAPFRLMGRTLNRTADAVESHTGSEAIASATTVAVGFIVFAGPAITVVTLIAHFVFGIPWVYAPAR